MKKSYITYTLFLGLLGILVFSPGCKKFLDKDLQATLTQDNFPVSASDALLATNACYSALREWNYNSGGYPILDIMSDDANKGSNTNDQLSNLGPYNNFGITPSQDGLDRWWTALYKGIKYTNVVIDLVPDIDMDLDIRSRYIAEAKFIRALLYFDLVRAWGGVQIVTTTEPPADLPKSTADDVYNLIISDLNDAISDLPLRSEYAAKDVGRATKGAARTLLGKVYLYRHDYESAEPLLMSVINSGEYALESNFIDANGVNGNNGIESIFEVGALEFGSYYAGGNQYANTQGVRGTPNRGWGFNRPSLDLRYSFEEGDPRLKGTIIDLGDTMDVGTPDEVVILGDGPTPDSVFDSHGNLIEVECYNRKVWVPGKNTITQWGHHRRLIRYADVLLMAAEVLNKNGKTNDALNYLNQVRARARGNNNSILPDVTTTDQFLLDDKIFNERRYELALEGHRFWDIVRTGRAKEVLGPLGFKENKNELLPIPQNEIDISQGTLTQNPGY